MSLNVHQIPSIILPNNLFIIIISKKPHWQFIAKDTIILNNNMETTTPSFHHNIQQFSIFISSQLSRELLPYPPPFNKP